MRLVPPQPMLLLVLRAPELEAPLPFLLVLRGKDPAVQRPALLLVQRLVLLLARGGPEPMLLLVLGGPEPVVPLPLPVLALLPPLRLVAQQAMFLSALGGVDPAMQLPALLLAQRLVLLLARGAPEPVLLLVLGALEPVVPLPLPLPVLALLPPLRLVAQAMFLSALRGVDPVVPLPALALLQLALL